MLVRLILRHRMSLRPKYLMRALFLAQGSIWSSLFAHLEKRRNGQWLQNATPPLDPIFIIGHWRTGTTYLHQLLNLDPHLTAPTLYQCSYPESFICSRSYAEPILSHFIKGRRPMDNVSVGLDEPHEDEYALYRLTGFSPLSKLVFPKTKQYFLLDDDDFLPPPEERALWEQSLVSFVAKIKAATGKRPVLKNPFHCLRIPILLRLFPEAKFIEIHRDPLTVIPSTINMWNIIGRQNALNGNWCEPPIGEVISVFERISHQIRIDLDSVPKERRSALVFEVFEKDPIGEIERIYQNFGMDFCTAFRDNLNAFMCNNAGYKKNTYTLTENQRQEIQTRLGSYSNRS